MVTSAMAPKVPQDESRTLLSRQSGLRSVMTNDHGRLSMPFSMAEMRRAMHHPGKSRTTSAEWSLRLALRQEMQLLAPLVLPVKLLLTLLQEMRRCLGLTS